MVLFDTNAILRYILHDNPAMADSVERRLAEEPCFVPVEVVCELVYVLTGVYRVERQIVAETLTALAVLDNIRMAEFDVVSHALGIYASSTLDFVDCLLIGYARKKDYTVVTFDKKLQKQLDRTK
jgi:predicted nucleic-acid-binding protein